MGIKIEHGARHEIIADRVVGAHDGRWVAIEDETLLTLVDGTSMVAVPDPPSRVLGDVRFRRDGRLLLAAPHRFDLAAGEWMPDPFDGSDVWADSERAPGRRIAAAGWAPDGQALALVEETLGTTDQTIVWLNATTNTRMTAVDHWSAKHLILVTGDTDPLVIVASTLLEVWDPVTSTVRWHGEPGRWQITRMLIVGDSIVTADAGGNVHTTTLDHGIPGWATDLQSEVTGIAPLDVGLACATAEGRIALLDSEGRLITRTKLEAGIADLTAAGPRRLIAAHAAPATGVSELLVR